jgi:hypothetical protein
MAAPNRMSAEETDAKIKRGKKVIKAARRKARAVGIPQKQYLAGIIAGHYPPITDQESDAEADADAQ